MSRNRVLTARFLLGTVMCVMQPVLALAQAPAEPRTGTSIALGAGAGRASLDCSRCGDLTPGDPWRGGWGPAGYFSFGYWVRPQLRLAGEVNVWVRRSPSLKRDATLFSAAAVAHWQPVVAGLDLAAGLGPAGSILAGGPGFISSDGWALVLGVGYDISARSRVTVSPYARYFHFQTNAAVGDNRGVRVVGPANPGCVQFGLGFRWR